MAQIAARQLMIKRDKDIKIIDIHNVFCNCRLFRNRKRYKLQSGSGDRRNVEEQLGRAGFEAKQIEGKPQFQLDSHGLRRCGSCMCLMRKTDFSMIWRESGEMERFWRWMRF